VVVKGTQATEVAVIGAGPYGLAVAAHLKATGVTTRIFGKPMSSWTDHMPKGMFLKSAFDATDISSPRPGSSLIDYCLETGIAAYDDRHPIALDVFSNYGLRFQQRNLPEVEQVMVGRVSPSPGGFVIRLVNGEAFTSRAVVVASGHLAFTYTPPELQLEQPADGPPLVSHTKDHRDFAAFRGREVAIVGAGQSALESAVLLQEAGATVHLLVRGPNILWGGPPIDGSSLVRRIFKPRTAYGPGWSHVFVTEAPGLIRRLPAPLRISLVAHTYGPSGAWWLRRRFTGDIDTRLDTTVESVAEQGGRVAMSLRGAAGAHTSLVVDHVVAATGYQVDVDAISYLDPGLRAQVARVGTSGSPQLSASFQSTVAGLHFVGLSAAATFGPLLRFVHGTDFAARAVAQAIGGGALGRAA
jgi:cation diffusion facilitator CzcD-associated flavoprotein CzcO